VRDHKRSQFATFDSIGQLEEPTIAVPADDYFVKKVRERLPNAKLVMFNSVREFFESDEDQFDAMLMDAESGSAWSFRYPNFRPVIPAGGEIKIPLGIAAARQNRDLAEFLSQWIVLKEQSGELQELYDYWILGRVDADRPPRWSILRDVLGFGVD
jgi:ABC-type amino acid transport substrate-binding protein